ncbi:hypothetical protein EB796_007938 [Bugula neritina]|uniref:Uncharacterized protein n=1 Tax=Bugula neritina TaxID=10212 RepID=A0A7J7K863_BUGNE|nr:hypothetical protein EB796_007938 [Bugula neritina]
MKWYIHKGVPKEKIMKMELTLLALTLLTMSPMAATRKPIGTDGQTALTLEEVLFTVRDIFITIAIIVIYLGLCRVVTLVLPTCPDWVILLMISTLSALAYKAFTIIDGIVNNSSYV